MNGNPNSWHGSSVLIDNAASDMMVFSYNANMEDRAANYSTDAATTCQYDSEPADVNFIKETACVILDVRHFFELNLMNLIIRSQ